MQIQASLTPAAPVVKAPTGNLPDPAQGSTPFAQVLKQEIAGRRGSDAATPPEKGAAIPVKSRELAVPGSPEEAGAGKAVAEDVVNGQIMTVEMSNAITLKCELASPECPEDPHVAESNLNGGDNGAPVPSAPANVLALAGSLNQIASQPQEEATADCVQARLSAKVTEPIPSWSVEDLATPTRSKTPPDRSCPAAIKEEPLVPTTVAEVDYESPRRDIEVHLSGFADSPVGPAAATDPSVKSAVRNLEGMLLAISNPQPNESSHADLEVSGSQSPPLAQTPVELPKRLPVPAAEKLQPWVGTPAWESALGHKVCLMITDQQQSAFLTLNPPDLGPLQVVLTVNNDHASAAFFAVEPEVRRAVESAIPRLREMMDAAGIHLGDATVGAGASDDQKSNSSATHPAPIRTSDGDDQGAVGTASRLTTPGVALGLVDTFA